MKKMLVLLAFSALTAGSTLAQTAPGPTSQPLSSPAAPARTPEQQADRTAQHLTRQLGLATDQTTRVRTAALSYHQQVQTLRTTYATANNRRGAGPELKTLRDTYEQQLQGILTPEQYAKYTQQRDEKLEQRRAQRGPRGTKS